MVIWPLVAMPLDLHVSYHQMHIYNSTRKRKIDEVLSKMTHKGLLNLRKAAEVVLTENYLQTVRKIFQVSR